MHPLRSTRSLGSLRSSARLATSAALLLSSFGLGLAACSGSGSTTPWRWTRQQAMRPWGQRPRRSSPSRSRWCLQRPPPPPGAWRTRARTFASSRRDRSRSWKWTPPVCRPAPISTSSSPRSRTRPSASPGIKETCAPTRRAAPSDLHWPLQPRDVHRGARRRARAGDSRRSAVPGCLPEPADSPGPHLSSRPVVQLPADAVAAGCNNATTPFNGEHNAGPQALSTRNFPNEAGPLLHVQ